DFRSPRRSAGIGYAGEPGNAHRRQSAQGKGLVELREQRRGVEVCILSHADAGVAEIGVAEFVDRRRAEGSRVTKSAALGDVAAVGEISELVRSAVIDEIRR